MLVRSVGLVTFVQALALDGRDLTATFVAHGLRPDDWDIAEHTITWDEFCTALELIREEVGGLEQLRDLRSLSGPTEHSLVHRLSGFTVDLATLYRLNYEWNGYFSYPMHRVEIDRLSEDQLQVSVRFDPDGKGSLEASYAVWGALIAIPRLIGLPPASVEGTIRDEWGSSFLVHLPEETDPENRPPVTLTDADRRVVINSILDQGRVLRQANIDLSDALDEAAVRETALHEANQRRVRAEQDLAAQQQAALEAHHLAALGQMASTIAHDFANLLMLTSGSVAIILDDEHASPSVRRAAETVLTASNLGEAMITRLLTFATGGSADIAAFDLNEALRGRIELLERMLSHIELAVDLDDSVPPVLGDADRLMQALTNLALNARDAMQGRGSVTISTAPDDGGAVVTVTDSGPGMAPEVAAAAFEPFFTTKQGGTGLGLASARESVESMGGQITMTTAPGTGTTFRIELRPVPAPAARD